jgi:amino acid adenylation domain-containing protein
MVVSVLGVLKAGGAYLPLEAEAPTGRLHWMLGDTGAEVVITDSEHKGMVSGWGVEVVDVGEQRQEIGAYSGEEVESKAGADNLAYVIYTSGSTGRPKAVMVTHRSVVNLLSCMQELTGLDAQGKVLAVTPLSFDIAGLELWLPLMSGAQVEIISRELAVDGERLGQLLRERDVTLMQATPSTWRMILESGWQGAPQLHVLCGGESLSAELAAELRNRCGRLWNLYGPTETTIWSSAQELQGTETHVTIGRPLWNTQMYVLTRDLELLPEAVTGEMYIAGAGVARGYLHRPELTAERFMPDPYAKERGARMYRTGDLGRYIGGGEIEYLGRRDEQVKVRGYRIELGEIEEVIREQEWVREAVVVVREGEDGEKRLVAHVVVREGDEGQEQELRRRVSERLPWYMRPEMRMRERLPLSVNGKVDRRRLAEEGEEGEGGSKREREKARSEVEEVLVGIWEEVLGEEEVGIEDDFFELGGHSLRAMQLVSRVRRAFEIELPLEKVFTSSTIAQLAPVIVQVQAQQIDGAEVDRMLAELEGLPSDQMD